MCLLGGRGLFSPILAFLNILPPFSRRETTLICEFLFAALKDIEDIYFFEVNTKYISSNVLNISVISRVRSTSDIADIFNT